MDYNITLLNKVTFHNVTLARTHIVRIFAPITKTTWIHGRRVFY